MPADRENLRRRLRAIFVEELEEHVGVLNRGLLALEGDGGEPGADVVNELFRAAHSLKGAARSADVPTVATLAHRLEDALAALRGGASRPDGPLLAAMFQSADAVAAAGQRLRAGEDGSGADVDGAVEALAAAIDGGGAAAMQTSPGPRDEVRGEVRGATVRRDGPAPAPAGPHDADALTLAGPPGAPGPAAEPPAGPHEAVEHAPAAASLTAVATTPPSVEARPRRTPEAAAVRVGAEKLEALLNHTGQLVAAGQQVEALVREVEAAADAAAASSSAGGAPAVGAGGPPAAVLDRLARAAGDSGRVLRHAVRAVAEGVRDAGMLPFGQVCDGLDRVVRDLARASGKEARLVVEGAAVELERPIVAALREPVLHLVRNAVDHGIELPARREEVGKPRSGVVRVAAAPRGTSVEVTVADDGAGVDVDALRTAAGGAGGAPDTGGSVPEDALLDLAFTPGVSTAPVVTEVSGRGVGLDAARATVERLGGSARLTSVPGGGVQAVLTVPITLSALRAVLVAAAGEVVAFPSAAVSRLVRLAPGELQGVDTGEVLRVGDRAVPVLHLSDALGLAPDGATDDAGGAATVPAVLVGGHGGAEAALVVDGLVDEQEIVMKPLGERLEGVPAALGATVLPSGRVALVMNPVALARAGARRRRSVPAAAEQERTGPPPRVLLVEDTLTTRALERSILEAAGYDVVVAVDGADGWRALHEHGADLVVSDVQMPRMDGLALCEAIRSSPRFRDVPVVLVTSLASEEDRRRGVEAGANAYVVKSSFEQPVLLETIERLL